MQDFTPTFVAKSAEEKDDSTECWLGETGNPGSNELEMRSTESCLFPDVIIREGKNQEDSDIHGMPSIQHTQ